MLYTNTFFVINIEGTINYFRVLIQLLMVILVIQFCILELPTLNIVEQLYNIYNIESAQKLKDSCERVTNDIKNGSLITQTCLRTWCWL